MDLKAVSRKLLIWLLVLATMLGIAYGFSNLLDRVQHWAMYNSGASRLTR